MPTLRTIDVCPFDGEEVKEEKCNGCSYGLLRQITRDIHIGTGQLQRAFICNYKGEIFEAVDNKTKGGNNEGDKNEDDKV